MTVSLAQLLRDYRIKQNLSQKELADEAGVGRTYIALLEQGVRRNPSREILHKLAGALRMSATEQQRLFLSAHGAVPSGQPNAPMNPPVMDALSEFLALPPGSPLAWAKLEKVFQRLKAILSEQGLSRKEKKRVDAFALLTQGYSFPPLSDARRKTATKATKSLRRSQRDRIRIAQQLHSLIEIFVSGTMPNSVKATLADDLLSLAEWKRHEYEDKLAAASKTKPKSRKRKGSRPK
ncbi:MAG: helix-turn-helix transcriptional regulator [Planctomycetota bacterium]|jgi:transcriptional regulator with XRE-family HTH domain